MNFRNVEFRKSKIIAIRFRKCFCQNQKTAVVVAFVFNNRLFSAIPHGDIRIIESIIEWLGFKETSRIIKVPTPPPQAGFSFLRTA